MSETLETLQRLVEDWMEDVRYRIQKAKNSDNDQAVIGHIEYLNELSQVYKRLINTSLNNFIDHIALRRMDIEDQIKEQFPRVTEILKNFEIYKYNDWAYTIVIDADQDLGQPPMIAMRQIIRIIEMNTPNKPSILIMRT